LCLACNKKKRSLPDDKTKHLKATMGDREIIHIAVAPPVNIGADLVNRVSEVIYKNPYDTKLLLSGKTPKIISHCESIKKAESIIANLEALGVTCIAFKDSDLRQRQQTFKAQAIEFTEHGILIRDKSGRERNLEKSNVFLILEGKRQTSEDLESTATKTRLNLTATLLTGGIPVLRKVKEKTSTQPVQIEYFVRLCSHAPSEPCVEILQHQMNYSFLGGTKEISSLANFNRLVSKLREKFSEAIFDNRLTKAFGTFAHSYNALDDMEINCKLIYSFHLLARGI
jgi:hypothetical protein